MKKTRKKHLLNLITLFFAYNVIVGDAFVPDSVLYHRCSVYDLSLIKAGGVVPPGDFSDP